MGTPRHDLNAEKAVIGAVMLDQRVLDDLTLSAQDFHLPRHEELWELIATEARAGRPVDALSLSQRVKDPDYLHECVAAAPTAAVAGHYGAIVRGLAHMRSIQTVAAKLASIGETGEYDTAEQAIDNSRAELERVAQAATGARVRTFADALADAIGAWENPHDEAMPTGWPDLDAKMNGGWRPGHLTIVGARPAVGKTVIAGCAAVAAATAGVGFFNLEMNEREIVERMAAAAQGIQLSKLTGGHLEESDWRKIAKLASRSETWPVYIDSESRLSMAQIRARVRTWMRRGHVPLVIIDYLQLITPADRREQRERQVARIAEDCKHLAKEFNTHVMALAQVNRASTTRTDPRPTMADLRESGGIEAFADNIVLLHRDLQRESILEFIISKNRHGETGTVELAWRPQYASANSLSHHDHEAAYKFGIEP